MKNLEISNVLKRSSDIRKELIFESIGGGSDKEVFDNVLKIKRKYNQHKREVFKYNLEKFYNENQKNSRQICQSAYKEDSGLSFNYFYNTVRKYETKGFKADGDNKQITKMITDYLDVKREEIITER